jgi:hypothetical protein
MWENFSTSCTGHLLIGSPYLVAISSMSCGFFLHYLSATFLSSAFVLKYLGCLHLLSMVLVQSSCHVQTCFFFHQCNYTQIGKKHSETIHLAVTNAVTTLLRAFGWRYQMYQMRRRRWNCHAAVAGMELPSLHSTCRCSLQSCRTLLWRPLLGDSILCSYWTRDAKGLLAAGLLVIVEPCRWWWCGDG